VETKDSLGRVVHVGDRVRVIAIAESVLNALSSDERERVSTMLGGEFEVEEIDEHGQAWVTKWWKRNAGESQSHCLGLAPAEIGLLTNPETT
jgi:hypothetical protein